MSVEQLQQLDRNLIELGHHSFEHKRYESLSKEELDIDFVKCKSFIIDNQLAVNSFWRKHLVIIQNQKLTLLFLSK